MSERDELGERICRNERKIAVLRECGARIERDMLRLAESLARDGFTKGQILEAIEQQRPSFDAAVQAALREVTIMELMESAQDG